MKTDLKRIKNPLILFLVNLLLLHLILYLGVFALGKAGIHNFNILLLIPSVVYAVGLLLYEKVITQSHKISLKIYWVLVLIVPLVLYGTVFISAYFFDFPAIESSGSVWYLIFFGVFFIFTSVITGMAKLLFFLASKMNKA